MFAALCYEAMCQPRFLGTVFPTHSLHTTQSVRCLFSLKQFVEDRVNWTLPYVRTHTQSLEWLTIFYLSSLFRNILS